MSLIIVISKVKNKRSIELYGGIQGQPFFQNLIIVLLPKGMMLHRPAVWGITPTSQLKKRVSVVQEFNGGT